MGISLSASNLASRAARSTSTGGAIVRTIGQSDQQGGIVGTIGQFLGGIFDGLANFNHWLIGLVGSGISIGFTDLWGLFVQTTTFIYNFNWQATDEQLDQQLQGAIAGLSAQYGGAIGQAFGYLACGIVPSAAIFSFNELLGAYLLKQVGEEALDDLTGELVNVIRSTFRVGAQSIIIRRFKNTRKLIKKWNEETPSDSWEKKLLERLFGSQVDDAIATWGDKDRKPWSFRIWTDQRIESIQNPVLRNFIEELYEEFLDSCVEAGYILTAGLDNWILNQRMTANEITGQQKVVELQPDRSVPEERIILAGGENEIRSKLPMMMANHSLVENRDVGQWIGEPVAQSVRNTPNKLTLRIQLYSDPDKPVRERRQRVSITIPDVSRTKLGFNEIKQAVGGKNGYIYGRFRGKARLDNGKTIDVYCSSSQETEQRLTELAKLTDAEILAITVTEETKTALKANGKPLEKQPVRVYPYSIYLENKQKILNQSTDEKGFQTLDGTYKRKDKRIYIFDDQAPPNYNQLINELLQTEGAG